MKIINALTLFVIVIVLQEAKAFYIPNFFAGIANLPFGLGGISSSLLPAGANTTAATDIDVSSASGVNDPNALSAGSTNIGAKSTGKVAAQGDVNADATSDAPGGAATSLADSNVAANSTNGGPSTAISNTNSRAISADGPAVAVAHSTATSVS